MSAVEAAISTLLSGILVPVAQAAAEPVLLVAVLVSCLVIKSALAYLIAPIFGVASVALVHGRLFVADGFESVMPFGWVFAAFGGALLDTFVLRTVFQRFFARGMA